MISSVQLFVTPLTVARQDPSSMGFPRQQYWNGLPFPSSGDLSDPGTKPETPALAGGVLLPSHQGRPSWGIIVQLLSHIQLFAIEWTIACQAFLSFTISWSLLKLIFIESVIPSNHLILWHPLLILPSIFSSRRVQVAKVLELQLQHQSFQWIFRTDFL